MTDCGGLSIIRKIHSAAQPKILRNALSLKAKKNPAAEARGFSETQFF
jgi:hypothetical protein